MCGVAGFWNLETGAPADPELLRQMLGVIRHRGPDESGIHVEGAVGIGSARLSIVDLPGGHQPIANEDGSIWIVFNGEIFNYPELRESLVAKGHQFRTRSDTEVIVHLYEEVGEDCVHHFNGQFVFALWDGRREALFLGRDRLGVRPLFHTMQGGRFSFASEMKALFQDPSIPREMDPFALDQVFTFWFPVAPRTGFVGIQELPPGHTMTVDRNGIRTRRYWKLEYPSAAEARDDRHPDAWYEERLLHLLDDAVRIRLRADVTVGAYLSGGLDSSVIAALCKRHIQDRLKTFSIRFEAEDYDETPFQREMASHLGTEHHAFLCESAEIGRRLPDAMWHAERPIVRLAPVPMMLLAKGVHEDGIKVVLTGEGADETLAGYDIFKEAKVRRFWARNPKSRFRALLLNRLYPYQPAMRDASGYLHQFFGQDLERVDDPFYSHRPRWRLTGGIKALYAPSMRERLRGYDPVAELEGQLPAEFRTWHPLSQAQYLELAYLLPGYILSSQGDRMAMAHSVEGRFPFLDHRVVEFAATIPPSVKLKRLREKHVLREIARDLLPETIRERVKQPYRAPDHAALFPRGSRLDLVDEMLAPQALEETGVFASPPLQALRSKGLRQDTLGVRDSMAIVGALSTQLIHHLFVGQRGGQAWIHKRNCAGSSSRTFSTETRPSL